jgi:hypothetical protein
MEVRIWLLIHFLAALTGGGMLTAMADEKVTSEYYTAFLNISFLDETRGVLHTERTETGRFSSSSVKEVAGIVVELVSNLTETIIEGSDNQVDHVLDYSGNIFYFFVCGTHFGKSLLGSCIGKSLRNPEVSGLEWPGVAWSCLDLPGVT